MNSELQLRDIHLPAEVGWWPPAIGWWVLALIVLILLVILLQRWRQNRPQPVPAVCGPALAELERLEHTYGNEPEQLIREVSVLLRRSAMSLYGRHKVSGLSGDNWLAFLDQRNKYDDVFSGQFRRMLTELPYREHDEGGVAELVTAVREWLQAQQDGGARHV